MDLKILVYGKDPMSFPIDTFHKVFWEAHLKPYI